VEWAAWTWKVKFDLFRCTLPVKFHDERLTYNRAALMKQMGGMGGGGGDFAGMGMGAEDDDDDDDDSGSGGGDDDALPDLEEVN
jgi:hypothetical protein